MASAQHTLLVQSTSWTQHPTGHCHPPCLPVPERKEAFQQAFVSNPEMHALANMIITGWAYDIKAVTCLLCPYRQHCETLTIENGHVLCGEALIIPSIRKERMLQQLHQFHQGITKAQLFACGFVFWQGINKAIEEAVQQCETCTWFQAQNATAPLTPMPTPSPPMACVQWTFFTLEGIDHSDLWWLYSKIMILIWHFPSGQSKLSKLSHCSKKCSQSTEFLKYSALTMALSMWVHSSLSSAPLEVSQWDLKPPLPTIEWICQGMCKICEACTPMC